MSKTYRAKDYTGTSKKTFIRKNQKRPKNQSKRVLAILINGELI